MGKMLIIDIDYHDGRPPAEFRIPSPAPQLVAISRHGGMHMLYDEDDDAYAAILDVAHWNPGASGIDLLRVKNDQYKWDKPSAPTAGRFASMYQAHKSDITIVPEPWGKYNIGDRLGKQFCPSGSHDSDPDPRPSVVIYDDGVHCYRCQRTWKWGELNPAASTFVEAVRDHIHWDQIVFQLMHHTHYLVPATVLRRAWRLFMMDVLDDECAPELITMMTEPLNVIRGPDGRWYSDEYNVYRMNATDKLIKYLPFIYKWRYDEEKETYKKFVVPYKRNKAISNDEVLSNKWPKYTYATEPLNHIIEPNQAIISQTLCYTAFANPSMPAKRFIPKAGDPDVFVEYLNQLPNFPWEEFKVLIGCAILAKYHEDIQIPPVIAVTGPSGSGKGLLVKFVNAAFGIDSTNVVMPSGETSEWSRQFNVFLYKEQPAILAIDEFNKYPSRSFNYCLSIDKRMKARMLHHDAVTFKLRSAVAFLGTQIPSKWTSDTQIHRRCMHIDLKGSRYDWFGVDVTPETITSDRTLQESAYGYVYQLYLESLQYRDKYQWLLSHDCVDFLMGDHSADRHGRIHDLLEGLAQSTRNDTKYPRERGWITIHALHDIGTPAYEAWESVADGKPGTEGWAASDFLHAIDIGRDLGLPYSVQVKVARRYKHVVAIKFEPSIERILNDLG